MKVRIGIGIGGAATNAAGLGEIVDALAESGFDSIWLSEVLTAPGFDPLAALGWIAGRRPGTKLGTTMLLPGRNVVRLAKQLATVDTLSGGNLLVTFVPGIAEGAERGAVGTPVPQRRAVMEEALPLVRRLLAGETVTHHGTVASLAGVTLAPVPVQQPLDLWLGGMAPRSLELCGRLGDGWLPSRCTPEAASAGREHVEQAAAMAGRTISPEHFGASIGYSQRPLDQLDQRAITPRSGGPEPGDVIPVGLDALRDRVVAFIDAGFSKFVVRPLDPPRSWRAGLAELAAALLDLQT